MYGPGQERARDRRSGGPELGHALEQHLDARGDERGRLLGRAALQLVEARDGRLAVGDAQSP